MGFLVTVSKQLTWGKTNHNLPWCQIAAEVETLRQVSDSVKLSQHQKTASKQERVFKKLGQMTKLYLLILWNGTVHSSSLNLDQMYWLRKTLLNTQYVISATRGLSITKLKEAWDLGSCYLTWLRKKCSQTRSYFKVLFTLRLVTFAGFLPHSLPLFWEL